MIKMPTSQALKEYLAGELLLAADAIESSDNPIDQAYYFSAVYGALQRVINIEGSSSLILMHIVTVAAHNAINSRLEAIKEGREVPVKLPKTIFVTVAQLTRELAARITDDKDVIDVLEAFSVLAFSTTGNGFYLMVTGRLPFTEAPSANEPAQPS